MYFKALNSALALVALFVTTSVIAEPIAARQGQIDCKATEPRCPDGFFCCDLPTTPTPLLTVPGIRFIATQQALIVEGLVRKPSRSPNALRPGTSSTIVGAVAKRKTYIGGSGDKDILRSFFYSTRHTSSSPVPKVWSTKTQGSSVGSYMFSTNSFSKVVDLSVPPRWYNRNYYCKQRKGPDFL
ncbi:hypothetical protein K435DRAFT_810496 [Dendrothele bispora CBS 962.96]|uniref:Uncharacterized protein n=1 Tax=Dendrothele bispora (strain CBS 962.96) TaxID=1314807 RepID=A0A4S8KV92_DENBC|nr:hypothetical protein K435DRAFT_810496 [Dendrothele bispora CBS 962.96]